MSGSDRSAQPALGWREQQIEEELPELGVAWVEAALGGRSATRGSPPEVRERLRELSNRLGGARAVSVRREPIPSAYRVFYRQIGLDPDVVRTPVEAAMFARMMDGGLLPRNLLEDVLLIALIDTSVPVWALDADTVTPPLGIRVSREREPFGRGAGAIALPAGRIVVADADAPLAELFGETAPGHGPSGSTERLLLFAIQVAGVPWLHIEEALWMCRTTVEAGTHRL